MPDCNRELSGNFATVWGTVLVTLSDEGGGPTMCGYTERLRLQLVLLMCHLVVLHVEEDRVEMVRRLPHQHLVSPLCKVIVKFFKVFVGYFVLQIISLIFYCLRLKFLLAIFLRWAK